MMLKDLLNHLGKAAALYSNIGVRLLFTILIKSNFFKNLLSKQASDFNFWPSVWSINNIAVED